MPDQITKLLDQIDRLDQEATKGPWESLGHSVASRTTYDEVVSTEVDCETYCMGGTGKGVQDDSDAEFIALARTVLPQLAKALRAVMELHPAIYGESNSVGTGSPVEWCPTCSDYYPCPTVQAITDAMSGDDDA